MTLKFGFYPAINEDRRYDSPDISQLFGVVLKDGVYEMFGDGMKVIPGSGLQVLVGIGRAWFNDTWTLNSELYPINFDPEAGDGNDVVYTIVLEIDKNNENRQNSFKAFMGVPGTAPQPPIIPVEPNVYRYPLADVYVALDAPPINPGYITNRIGTEDTPFGIFAEKSTVTDLETHQSNYKLISPKILKDSKQIPLLVPSNFGQKIVSLGDAWRLKSEDSWESIRDTSDSSINWPVITWYANEFVYKSWWLESITKYASGYSRLNVLNTNGPAALTTPWWGVAASRMGSEPILVVKKDSVYFDVPYTEFNHGLDSDTRSVVSKNMVYRMTIQADISKRIFPGDRLRIGSFTFSYFIVIDVSINPDNNNYWDVYFYSGQFGSLLTAPPVSTQKIQISHEKTPPGFPTDPARWSLEWRTKTSCAQNNRLGTNVWTGAHYYNDNGGIIVMFPIPHKGLWKITSKLRINVPARESGSTVGNITYFGMHLKSASYNGEVIDESIHMTCSFRATANGPDQVVNQSYMIDVPTNDMWLEPWFLHRIATSNFGGINRDIDQEYLSSIKIESGYF